MFIINTSLKFILQIISLHCFDTVAWVTGRPSSL